MGEIADDMAHAYGVYDDDHDPMCDPKSRVVLHDRRICDCNFIARVREDERGFCDEVAIYERGLIEGQRDEREKWSVLIKDRIRDLQSCTKHDDCMGKADILLVILDDYDYGVA